MSNDLTQFFGGQPLDANDPNLQSGGDYGLMPPGEYPAEITRSEIKQTKAGNGQYVEFEIAIVGDAFNGRRVWHRCNISNPNAKAVEIGMQQLAEMARACGILALRTCDEVVGKFVTVKLRVKDDRNEVARVSTYKVGAPTTMAAPPRPTTTAMPAPQPQPGRFANETIPF